MVLHKILQGHHVAINARNDDDVEESVIIEKVKSSSGERILFSLHIICTKLGFYYWSMTQLVVYRTTHPFFRSKLQLP